MKSIEADIPEKLAIEVENYVKKDGSLMKERYNGPHNSDNMLRYR